MLQKNASQQTKKYVLVEKKIQVILLHTIEIMDQKIQVIKKKLQVIYQRNATCEKQDILLHLYCINAY